MRPCWVHLFRIPKRSGLHSTLPWWVKKYKEIIFKNICKRDPSWSNALLHLITKFPSFAGSGCGHVLHVRKARREGGQVREASITSIDNRQCRTHRAAGCASRLFEASSVYEDIIFQISMLKGPGASSVARLGSTPPH